MRTKIFCYNGIIGILSGPDSEGLVAKPEGGNLGCVLESTGVDISHDALELLKKVRRGHDDLGEVDIFSAGEKVIVGWLGGYMKAFRPEDIEGSSSYNASLLKATEGVETPQEFKDFVDSL